MQMDNLTLETLRELLDESAYPCVSIYMPTRPDAPFGSEHRTRFKTLLQRAEQTIQEEYELDEDQAATLFASGRELVNNTEFWRYQSLGLAHFAAPGRHYTLRLPQSFEELALCSRRFHIKPLLPLFSEDGHFYVLALSQNKVRLLKANRHSSQEIPLEGAPASLEESARFDDPEKQTQFHTRDSSPQGDRPAVFHGQGVGIDDKKPRIDEFVRKVDAALQDVIGEDPAPLVVASVESLFPHYAENSKLKNLVQEPLRGNPDESSEEELRRGAWEIMEPIFRKQRESAASTFHDRQGTGLASNMLEEVVPAAMHGRVATLFVPLGVRKWGGFQPDTGTAVLHEQKLPESVDLLDLAAANTLGQGGRVFALEPSQLPGERDIAAVFRY